MRDSCDFVVPITRRGTVGGVVQEVGCRDAVHDEGPPLRGWHSGGKAKVGSPRFCSDQGKDALTAGRKGVMRSERACKSL